MLTRLYVTVFFIMSSEPDNVANLSVILDSSNDLIDVLDLPVTVCSDLNYKPFEYTSTCLMRPPS